MFDSGNRELSPCIQNFLGHIMLQENILALRCKVWVACQEQLPLISEGLTSTFWCYRMRFDMSHPIRRVLPFSRDDWKGDSDQPGLRRTFWYTPSVLATLEALWGSWVEACLELLLSWLDQFRCLYVGRQSWRICQIWHQTRILADSSLVGISLIFWRFTKHLADDLISFWTWVPDHPHSAPHFCATSLQKWFASAFDR